MACKHEHTRKVVVGAPAKWCTHCGAVWDGVRWHRHSGAGTSPKRHVQRDAYKAARVVAKHPRKKARSPAQRAATARMIAARAAKHHGAR